MATGAIFLNGSYGVGKSSTLDHIADLLADAGQPFSLMECRLVPPVLAACGRRQGQQGHRSAEHGDGVGQLSDRRTASVGDQGVVASHEDLQRCNDALRLTGSRHHTRPSVGTGDSRQVGLEQHRIHTESEAVQDICDFFLYWLGS